MMIYMKIKRGLPNAYEYWKLRINTWIDDLINNETDIVIWQEEDKLFAEDAISDFKSIHSRISQKPITLYHFWIVLN